MSHPIPFRTRTLNPFAPMVLCLKARESRSLPGLLNIIWNEFFLLQVFKPPAFAGGFFLTDLQKLCLQMPVGSGRFFASLRRIGFASEKGRPCCGRVFCGRYSGFLAVMLSIICFADKKWRGSRKVYKIKGRTKCNEYEKFDTCSRKIAHCLSSSFLYNLFRNLIHVIILFLSLYLFLILFFIPGVCL